MNPGRYNRRRFLKTMGTGTAAALLTKCSDKPTGSDAAGQAAETGANLTMRDNIFWGDLHTHTRLSDGNGEFPDHFEIAKSHLDFWTMTDHAFDEQVFSLDYRQFNRPDRPPRRLLNEAWADVQEMCRAYEKPGDFIPFLGYEWTNFRYGHHNVYYLDYDQPIRMPLTLPDLYAELKDVDAMVIPHHTGYPVGYCGKDWDFHDDRLTPFVELFSIHGSSETSEGLQLLLAPGSWMGPGASGGCVQAGLARGHKLGISASSDSHMNHPGAYDLGLMAAYSEDLSRSSLWGAFQKRRIYAVSGDRILLAFSINGHPMGSTVPASKKRILQVSAVGWNKIERVEIIKNNAILHAFMEPKGASPSPGQVRFRFFVEWGWDARFEHHWEGSLTLSQGRILQAIPCYRGNVAGRKGTGVQKLTDSICQWDANTEKAKYDGLARRYADGMAFEVECPDHAKIDLTMTCEALQQKLQLKAADIMEKSRVTYMEAIPPTHDGNYWRNLETATKFKVHQGWPTSYLSVDLSYEDDARTEKRTGTDFYYVRVIQRNRQRAWSSPIWVERI